MKIWKSYGSEHSANLVMIGRFKDEASAEKALEAIEKVTELMGTIPDSDRDSRRFPDEALEVLRECNAFNLSPAELEQFIFGVHPSLEGTQINIRTDEPDLSAFMKLMVDFGARVEVYCASDYPELSQAKKPKTDNQ